MARVKKEQIEYAKQLDLLTYMRLYEPHELVRKGNDYCTREHDSLTISENGLWHWFSRGVGGKTALQYLIKVKEMDFVDAVLHLCCDTLAQQNQSSPTKEVDNKKQKFLLPKAYKNNDRVVEYLRLRKISDFIIDYCIDNKLLYESADYHNAVFVGYDRKGVARYATLRGTWKHMANSFKGEVAGSDKRFSFSVPAIDKSDKLIVTESALCEFLHNALYEQLVFMFRSRRKYSCRHIIQEKASHNNPRKGRGGVCLWIKKRNEIISATAK